jgi:hypothetical protein
MTLIGIVRLGTTAAHFAEYSQEIERLVATEHVSMLSRIDTAELQAALQSYPVMPDDVREVPSCEVGDCDVKLPRNTILQLSQLDPDAHGYEHRVTTVIREWLHKYLTAYERNGNAALVRYGDKDPPQSLRDGFTELIADAQVFGYRAPALYDYFADVVDRLPDGTSESFVWSVEEFGMRPLTTVTHTIADLEPQETHADVWIAMKLLYASHYLQASLRTIRVIDDRSSVEPASYLVCVDRLMFDTKVGGIVRAMAKRRLRSHLADRLKNISEAVGAYGVVTQDRVEGS